MENIHTYIKWRGDLPFSKVPFNEADNLAFCCLSYIRFQGVFALTHKKSITIRESYEKFMTLENQMYRTEDDLVLFELMAHSVRYQNVKIHAYVDHIDEQLQKQFSALTLQFYGPHCYVAFRGTDNTLVGWKEDFNMTFMETVPSQKEAVEYLNMVASKHKGKLYIGGHSKGGNLAVFASAFCEPEIKERIVSVYNNDGPGFSEQVLKSDGYRHMKERVQTYVPQSSVVGMLLNHEEMIHVVKSTQISLWQHDPYSWQIMGPDFQYLETIDTSSQLMDKTMKNWLSGLTVEQRAAFVDTMYDIFHSTNAKSLKELKENKIKNIAILLKAFSNTDANTRKMMNDTLSAFFSSMKDAVEEMLPKEDK